MAQGCLLAFALGPALEREGDEGGGVAADVERRIDDGVNGNVGAALRDDILSVQRADVAVAHGNVVDLGGEIVGGEVEGDGALIEDRNAVENDGAAYGEIENLVFAVAGGGMLWLRLVR